MGTSNPEDYLEIEDSRYEAAFAFAGTVYDPDCTPCGQIITDAHAIHMASIVGADYFEGFLIYPIDTVN